MMNTRYIDVKESIRRELDSQVARRVEERIKTVKRMELMNSMEEERHERLAAEMRQAQSKLRALEQKSSFIVLIKG